MGYFITFPLSNPAQPVIPVQAHIYKHIDLNTPKSYWENSRRTMMRLLVWGCVIYSCVTTGFFASSDTEYSEDYYDDYMYSQEQETEQSESRRRVLFDDDQENEEADSSAVKFSAKNAKYPLNQKISFFMPEERLPKIEMTLRELNESFDKKKYMKSRKEKLSRQSEKIA